MLNTGPVPYEASSRAIQLVPWWVKMNHQGGVLTLIIRAFRYPYTSLMQLRNDVRLNMETSHLPRYLLSTYFAPIFSFGHDSGSNQLYRPGQLRMFLGPQENEHPAMETSDGIPQI